MEFMSSTIAYHPLQPLSLMMTHRSRPSFVSMKLIPPPASITVPCKLARNPNYETPRHIIITKPLTMLSFLKTTFVTAVAVSAIFLSPRRFTSMAAPVDQSKIINTEADELEEHEVIKALKTLMEYKVKNGKVEEAAGIINQLKYHLHGCSTDYEDVESAAAAKKLKEVEEVTRQRMKWCLKYPSKYLENYRNQKLMLAQILLTRGDYDDALKICQELVHELPKDMKPYCTQGIIYSLLGKKDDAEHSFGMVDKIFTGRLWLTVDYILLAIAILHIVFCFVVGVFCMMSRRK